jgi:uncharacterized protein involved in copper resistance
METTFNPAKENRAMLKKLATAALVLALAVPAFADSAKVPASEPIPTTARPVSTPAAKKVEKKADKAEKKAVKAEQKAEKKADKAEKKAE